MVLKFFAYFYNREQFDHSVVGFLTDYMIESNKQFNYRKARQLFADTFSGLSEALPEGIRRGNRSRTPINLYEAIAVGAADAINEGAIIHNKNVSTWMNDDELKALTSGATNSRKRVVDRIKYCYERFK